MAVPKRKVSKSRSRKRYAHYKTAAPAMTACGQCHEPKINHRVCPKCGYYGGARRLHIGNAE